jgi:CBS domain containing-hemolysin-like protein
MKLVYILLALGFLKCVWLYKLYNSVPALELKRQARSKNRQAEALYKVAAYESSLDVLLWLAGTAIGATLFIWSARTGPWPAAAVVVIAAWLIIWSPAPRWDGWFGAVSSITAKYMAGVLSFMNPVLGRIAGWYPPAGRVRLHTGLYEKPDMLDLLSRQNRLLDNRIDQTDLRIAAGALTFGDKTVSSVMTPRRKIKFVEAGDTIGPMVMDELHKSGHSRFPVVKGSPKATTPDIVGTLYLKDIIGHEGGGKIKDLARKDVYYINEDSNLRQALSAFLKTHHHMLIVVNSFEEVIGVLSIEDVLEQIIGEPINDEFDNYDSLRAVASKEAQPEHKNHNEVPVAPEAE